MRISKLAAQRAHLLFIQASQTMPQAPPAAEIDPRPEMLCFRAQTQALVRHFFEVSCQMGRVPSILGRELFRAKVSHHAIPSFEEYAVFVRDIELCLSKLSAAHKEIITLVGLYNFSHEEVGEMLQRSRGWIIDHFAQAIDCLSEIFLQAGLLLENRPDRWQKQVRNRSAAGSAAVRKKPPVNIAAAEEIPEAGNDGGNSQHGSALA